MNIVCDNVEVVDIASLSFLDGNPMSHPSKNLEAIKESLEKYGQRKPIVVNTKTKQVEAGNGTLAGAKSLGWTQIGVVFVDDDEETQDGYVIADNQTSRLAKWDKKLLNAMIKRANKPDEIPGVDKDFLDKFCGVGVDDGQGVDIDQGGNDFDVEAGQVWVIPSKTNKNRKHIVFCGNIVEQNIFDLAGATIKPNALLTRGYVYLYDIHGSFNLEKIFVLGAWENNVDIPDFDGDNLLIWEKANGLPDDQFETCWTSENFGKLIIKGSLTEFWETIIKSYIDQGDTILTPNIEAGEILVGAEKNKVIIYGADNDPANVSLTLKMALALGLEPELMAR